MPARKRGRAELEAVEPPPPPSLLSQIRNRWEFANLVQYIYLFGDAVKIDKEIDVEELENECLRTEPSQRLAEIGLCLLKFVSSHRGLTPGMFDEYTRRQYEAKAPNRNPFGQEEEPRKFQEFDVFTKLRVLWQLSQWTFFNPDRLRERMPTEEDQTYWRTEEIGYDRNGRLYFVHDDNRLYRRTDPPIIEPQRKPKANSKAGRALARANKKRKISTRADSAEEEENNEIHEAQDAEEDLFGGRKWECLAVSLSEYQEFLEGVKGSKDPQERDLCKRIEREVLPEIVKAEEDRQRKIRQKERELLTQEKMSHAKRSSRIANKQEKEREVAEAEAAERKRREDLAEARKMMERQQKGEQDRQSRMQTREQRIKEREAKRILEEQELKELTDAQEKGETRASERTAKAKMSKKRKALQELEQEDDWFFDCSGCGVHGENIDDGSHSVSCEKCNVWQHSKCLGISEAEAEEDDFHFICADCKRKKEDAKRPKIPPLKLKAPSSSVSPPSNKNKKVRLSSDCIEVQVPKRPVMSSTGIPGTYLTNGFSTSSAHQTSHASPPRPTAPSLHRPVGAQAQNFVTKTSSHQQVHANGAVLNAADYQQSQGTKPAPPSLPPIGHFGPLARTSAATSMSIPKPKPPKSHPALSAYTSPWSQANGNSILNDASSSSSHQTPNTSHTSTIQQKTQLSPPQVPSSSITDGPSTNGVLQSYQPMKQETQTQVSHQRSQPTPNGHGPSFTSSPPSHTPSSTDRLKINGIIDPTPAVNGEHVSASTQKPLPDLPQTSTQS